MRDSVVALHDADVGISAQTALDMAEDAADTALLGIEARDLLGRDLPLRSDRAGRA